MNKYEIGGNPSETRIETNNIQETKIEAENKLSLEELAEKVKQTVENAKENEAIIPKEISKAIESEKAELINESRNLDELFSVLDRIDNLNNISSWVDNKIHGSKKFIPYLK